MPIEVTLLSHSPEPMRSLYMAYRTCYSQLTPRQIRDRVEDERITEAQMKQMQTVAVGWELYERTHSAWALGLVGLMQVIPIIIFTLPSGQIVDRYDRRRVLMAANLVMAIGSLGLAAAS